MMNVQPGKIVDLKGGPRGGFKGEILLPSDGAYDSARQIWNAMIDKRPAIIARCTTTSDVVRGVNFARDNGLVLAVRGGGHQHRRQCSVQRRARHRPVEDEGSAS